MHKVNLSAIPLEHWESPKGEYQGSDQEISLALGHNPASFDLRERHPFEVALVRIEPGKKLCPFHAHSVQWELYIVVSGAGVARDSHGEHAIGPGDTFVFRPGEAHQLRCTSDEPLVYYVIADNVPGDSCYYPDSDKWLTRIAGRRTIGRMTEAEYFDGEE